MEEPTIEEVIKITKYLEIGKILEKNEIVEELKNF